jgi:hypothetical protein
MGVHSHLNGYINKQNGQMCASVHSHDITGTPLQPELCTAWFALPDCNIVGPICHISPHPPKEFLPSLSKIFFNQDETWQHTVTAVCSTGYAQ